MGVLDRSLALKSLNHFAFLARIDSNDCGVDQFVTDSLYELSAGCFNGTSLGRATGTGLETDDDLVGDFCLLISLGLAVDRDRRLCCKGR